MGTSSFGTKAATSQQSVPLTPGFSQFANTASTFQQGTMNAGSTNPALGFLQGNQQQPAQQSSFFNPAGSPQTTNIFQNVQPQQNNTNIFAQNSNPQQQQQHGFMSNPQQPPQQQPQQPSNIFASIASGSQNATSTQSNQNVFSQANSGFSGPTSNIFASANSQNSFLSNSSQQQSTFQQQQQPTFQQQQPQPNPFGQQQAAGSAPFNNIFASQPQTGSSQQNMPASLYAFRK